MSDVTQYPADRFTSLIDEILRVLDKHGAARRVHAPMLLLIWNRFNRMARLFAAIVARVRAGRLSRTTPAPVREASVRDRPVRVRTADELPRHFGWLVKMVPEVDVRSADLCWLLQRPEMEALIFEAPREVGRILRPLCQALGVELLPDLRLPLWARRRTPEAPPLPEIVPEEVDEAGWPVSLGSRLFWEMEREFWQFHPPREPRKLE